MLGYEIQTIFNVFAIKVTNVLYEASVRRREQ